MNTSMISGSGSGSSIEYCWLNISSLRATEHRRSVKGSSTANAFPVRFRLRPNTRASRSSDSALSAGLRQLNPRARCAMPRQRAVTFALSKGKCSILYQTP